MKFSNFSVGPIGFIVRGIIGLLFVVILISQFFIIKNLKKKLDNITILSYEDSNLVAFSPNTLKEKILVVTPEFVDNFNKYKSPFNDGMSFNDLVDKYIKNWRQDHYGTVRGTKDKRRIHEGIDLFVPENTPVYPISDFGIVTEVSDNPNYLVTVDCKRADGTPDSVKIEYGKVVRVLYPEGIETLYAHLNEVYVELGQQVNGDTQLGISGLTGNIRRSGKGSHLHMELHDKDGDSFDPRWKLRFEKNSLQHFLKYLNIDE